MLEKLPLILCPYVRHESHLISIKCNSNSTLLRYTYQKGKKLLRYPKKNLIQGYGCTMLSRIGAFGWILLVWLKIGERKGKKKKDLERKTLPIHFK